MILIHNINYLRDKYPFILMIQKKGDKTLVLNKDDKIIYSHRKYDSIKEGAV